MSEYTLGYIAVGNVFGIGLSSLFYMMGGRNFKALRRFLSPFILTLQIIISTILLGNFSWWLLLLYPLTMGMFCLDMEVTISEFALLSVV